jgi:hypothetical protein
MDPIEVIAGEPRTQGAKQATAPRAAQWLQNPTPQNAEPEPGSPEWWMDFLMKMGEAMRQEDEAKYRANAEARKQSCSQPKS